MAFRPDSTRVRFCRCVCLGHIAILECIEVHDRSRAGCFPGIPDHVPGKLDDYYGHHAGKQNSTELARSLSRVASRFVIQSTDQHVACGKPNTLCGLTAIVPPSRKFHCPNCRIQVTLMTTSMFPRVAFEYGQVSCAVRASASATSRSTPGRLMFSRACRK